MEEKKVNKKNLSRNKSIRWLVGLNIVLALILLCFNQVLEPLARETTNIEPPIIVCPYLKPTVIVEQEFVSNIETPKLPEPVVDVPSFIEDEKIIEPDDDNDENEDNTETDVNNDVDVTPTATNPNPSFGGLLPNLGTLTGTDDKKPDGPDPSSGVKSKPVTVSGAKTMAIYPKCDKYKPYRKAVIAGDEKAQKLALKSCFEKKLTQDIFSVLDVDDLQDSSIKSNKRTLKAKATFIVNEKGEIVDVKIKHGDEPMKPEVKKAMIKVAKKVQRKGGIIPATNEFDQVAPLTFSIPVKFQLQE